MGNFLFADFTKRWAKNYHIEKKHAIHFEGKMSGFVNLQKNTCQKIGFWQDYADFVRG
jgi:uncharacterized membrane protein